MKKIIKPLRAHFLSNPLDLLLFALISHRPHLNQTQAALSFRCNTHPAKCRNMADYSIVLSVLYTYNYFMTAVSTVCRNLNSNLKFKKNIVN